MQKDIWSLSESQRAMRRGMLRGSHAGSIVAGGEDWINLWELQTGRREEENLSGELRVMMGLATERFNAFWFEKMTGREITRIQEDVRHPTIPYLGCTLDGFSTTKHGKPAVWDSKHVGVFSEATELRYVAQMSHEALCCGVDHWILSVFVGNSRWEMLETELDLAFCAEYLAKCREFWGYVVSGRRPPEVRPLPVPAPRNLRRISLDDADELTWPNWGPEMIDKIQTFAATKAAFDKHALTREAIKTLLPEDVGEVSRGLFALKRNRANAITMTLKDAGDE